MLSHCNGSANFVRLGGKNGENDKVNISSHLLSGIPHKIKIWVSVLIGQPSWYCKNKDDEDTEPTERV
jgi:hypothetical protein